jgi:hypothetical protein
LAAARPSSRSISQNVNLSKLLLNSLNAPRPMRILRAGLRTHDGRPALVAGRHDSDRHCREQSSNASSLWRKTQMSSVLEILILVMTSASMDKTELAIFERLVCPIWNTGTRWLRETDLTKAKTFFTRNAQRRLGEYNRWAALARVPRSQIPRRCFVSTGCAKVQWSGTANYGIRLPDYQHPRSAAAPHCCPTQPIG